MQSLSKIRAELVQKMPQQDVARIDVELLLAKALDCSASSLIANSDIILSATDLARIEHLAERRINGEPVAYILGLAGFWNLDLNVNHAVLIPRPDTETLIEAALHILPVKPLWVADLGTGSGAIALALAGERPEYRLWATDISEMALHLAAKNCVFWQMQNTVRFLHSYWLDAFADKSLDVIISNPPYIALGDSCLETGDLCFEPQLALVSGQDGLEALRVIISQAPRVLKPSGWLLLEHGYNQSEQCMQLMCLQKFRNVHVWQDKASRDRVVAGQLP